MHKYITSDISKRIIPAPLILFLFFTITFFFILFAPEALFPQDNLSGIDAVESIISGLPVPEGSVLDEESYYNDSEGVQMAFYTHPVLTGNEVLTFFDVNMPLWGWELNPSGSAHLTQRYYSKEGVPAIIGVDKKDTGCSFSILVGVTGDWGYMAPMRPEK